MESKDIIKSFEYCNNRLTCGIECSYFGKKSCYNSLVKDILNLIKKQQAKIERLRAKCENTQIGYNFANDEIKNLKKEKFKLQKALNQSEDYRVIAKTEAYKEFADRLKEIVISIDGLFEVCEIEEQIDNLLKELTEKGGIE